ncbi:uncharacterized protein PHALS_13983 [Plasmopara halstedii]|uniref:Uncharacterized protein n=1 Tax=Plasmopara halstedii TaxID=4781 RepID=A0A0P1ARB3_PLAHL|nr:uncharacterized protein PHALS_13983 [Plasmopara halstedii]CEG43688.1 hypothetical protein PHALS_13983 [Plasmopara halstedii]|eukprot:XP_024580057.1 hypothetical protein PHALS_13983 [Plasmopara halstedii]
MQVCQPSMFRFCPAPLHNGLLQEFYNLFLAFQKEINFPAVFVDRESTLYLFWFAFIATSTKDFLWKDSVDEASTGNQDTLPEVHGEGSRANLLMDAWKFFTQYLTQWQFGCT